MNFAQGALAVTSAYVGYTVASATGSYWLGFVAALASGLVIGALLERVVMRPVEQAPPLNPVVVALGMVLVIQASLGMIYGNDFKPLPTPFSRAAWTIGGVAVLSPYDAVRLHGGVRADARAGAAVHADQGRVADAGVGLRPRGVPPPRGERRRGC